VAPEPADQIVEESGMKKISIVVAVSVPKNLMTGR
jgi:hypothetical protein